MASSGMEEWVERRPGEKRVSLSCREVVGYGNAIERKEVEVLRR